MGIFTRKRTPTFKWDDTWELVQYKKLDRETTDFYVFVCPDDVYLEFISFTCQVTYQGGVGSRKTWLDIHDGSEVITVSSVYNLAGATTHTFFYADHAQQARSSGGLSRLYIPFPKPAFMLPGWQLHWQTEGGLALDEIQWTNLLVKQWYIR